MTKAANRIKQKKNSADWSINLKLQNIRFSFANFIIFFLNTGNKFMFSLDELLITLAMRFNWFLRNRQFRCICCELETILTVIYCRKLHLNVTLHTIKNNFNNFFFIFFQFRVCFIIGFNNDWTIEKIACFCKSRWTQIVKCSA